MKKFNNGVFFVKQWGSKKKSRKCWGQDLEGARFIVNYLLGKLRKAEGEKKSPVTSN